MKPWFEWARLTDAGRKSNYTQWAHLYADYLLEDSALTEERFGRHYKNEHIVAVLTGMHGNADTKIAVNSGTRPAISAVLKQRLKAKWDGGTMEPCEGPGASEPKVPELPAASGAGAQTRPIEALRAHLSKSFEGEGPTATELKEWGITLFKNVLTKEEVAQVRRDLAKKGAVGPGATYLKATQGNGREGCYSKINGLNGSTILKQVEECAKVN